MQGRENTSSTSFGTLRPAFKGPLIGVHFFQEDIVVSDDRKEIFVDYVLVHQATLGFIFLRHDLGCREREERAMRDEMPSPLVTQVFTNV